MRHGLLLYGLSIGPEPNIINTGDLFKGVSFWITLQEYIVILKCLLFSKSPEVNLIPPYSAKLKDTLPSEGELGDRYIINFIESVRTSKKCSGRPIPNGYSALLHISNRDQVTSAKGYFLYPSCMEAKHAHMC